MNARSGQATVSYESLGGGGTVCLVACKDVGLALNLARTLEQNHFPVILITSVQGLDTPLMLNPDVAILDDLMYRDLKSATTRKAIVQISQPPMILLGDDQEPARIPALPSPALSLAKDSSASDIMHAIYTAVKSRRPAEGRVSRSADGKEEGPAMGAV